MSESSDKRDKDEKITGAEDINCNGDGRDDMNTGAGGESLEWIRFLSPSARTEALGTTEKAKASLLSALRKELKLEKVRVK